MKIKGFAYAISSAILWGIVYTVDQKILTKISPFMLVWVHSAIVFFLMLPLVATDIPSVRELITSDNKNLLLILISVVLATLANFCILTGIKILGASTASIFEIAYPFFIVVFSILFLKVAPNPSFFVGSIFLFLGSFIIIRYA